jgi:hypothetical protein
MGDGGMTANPDTPMGWRAEIGAQPIPIGGRIATISSCKCSATITIMATHAAIVVCPSLRNVTVSPSRIGTRNGFAFS